ncbi:MAG: YwqI/YxiC family protein [Clostridium sp.]|nr:YwqI/YxiC family protein [Clostridium sp.]
MEIKINKAEFDAVMRALNTSIAQFTDDGNAIMGEMITIWASGETDAPAFNQYLHRLIGANSLLTNYYHTLLVSNSAAIQKIADDYLELDDTSANQVTDTIIPNLIYSVGGTDY